jgi:uncharacterized protein YaiI (UPF0178 family)
VQIWVDADACPVPVKEILFRAADKRGFDVVLVANHFMRIPKSPHVRLLQVAHGFDVADRYIVEQIAKDDLVITADIPLAADVVENGGAALNPRGTFYTPENIKDHLARRNLMDELRSTGVISGGPAAFGKSDIQAFANALDRYLTRHSANL